MAFLAAHVPDLTTLKAAKLLYFADRAHELKHGRPILGDWYACLPRGPVPSSALDMLDTLRDEDPSSWTPDVKALSEHVIVRYEGRHPRFAGVLVDITHREPPWKKAWESHEREIDYQLFFDGEPHSEDMRALMLLEQENRDFVDELISDP